MLLVLALGAKTRSYIYVCILYVPPRVCTPYVWNRVVQQLKFRAALNVLVVHHRPGDVVRGAGGEAGLQTVGAVHTDRVRGLAVVGVGEGVQEDAGLRDQPAAELCPLLSVVSHVCVAVHCQS